MANPFERSKKLPRSPVSQANTQQNTTAAEESQQQQRDSNDEQQQQNGAPLAPECNAQKKVPLQKSRILIEKLGEQINELQKYVKGHRNVHADIKKISSNLKSAHTPVITQLDNEERKRSPTSPNPLAWLCAPSPTQKGRAISFNRDGNTCDTSSKTN